MADFGVRGNVFDSIIDIIIQNSYLSIVCKTTQSAEADMKAAFNKKKPWDTAIWLEASGGQQIGFTAKHNDVYLEAGWKEASGLKGAPLAAAVMEACPRDVTTLWISYKQGAKDQMIGIGLTGDSAPVAKALRDADGTSGETLAAALQKNAAASIATVERYTNGNLQAGPNNEPALLVKKAATTPAPR
jgi:hypothetical protein